MALAVPPDLTDTALPLQPLARAHPRGRYIEPHHTYWLVSLNHSLLDT